MGGSLQSWTLSADAGRLSPVSACPASCNALAATWVAAPASAGTGAGCGVLTPGAGAVLDVPAAPAAKTAPCSCSRSASKASCISLKRDHPACHDEGSVTRLACTAVTLYSGQS